MTAHGDLNNAHAARDKVELPVDEKFRHKTLAIAEAEDDATVRRLYRPFLLPDSLAAVDWVSELELSTAMKLVDTELLSKSKDRLRILVLYGSLRAR